MGIWLPLQQLTGRLKCLSFSRARYVPSSVTPNPVQEAESSLLDCLLRDVYCCNAAGNFI